MKIGGLIKYSFIDFSPRISCVIFTLGCNFRCPYCHNPGLVNPGPDSRIMEPEEIFGFIKKRIKYLEGIVISGGEPTIHKDLAEFCDSLKEFGLPLKLDTNGSNPDVIDRLIRDRKIDAVSMDIKTDPGRYMSLMPPGSDMPEIPRAIRIIISSGIPHEFRITCAHPFVDEDMINRIIPLVQDAQRIVFQKAKTSPVLAPSFFKNLGRPSTDSEIRSFAYMIQPHVNEVIIR